MDDDDDTIDKPGMVGDLPRHRLFSRLSERRDSDGVQWLFRRYRRATVNRVCIIAQNVVDENQFGIDVFVVAEIGVDEIAEHYTNILRTRLEQMDVLSVGQHETGVWEIVIPILFQLVKWAIEWHINREE